MSTRTPRDESGFTLVELLIVMVIMAILLGVLISTFGGSKDAAGNEDAIVTAQSLQKAVEAFRIDREGRVPSDATDWPAAAKGPVDATTGQPYMRTPVADSVLGGQVVVKASTGPAPGAVPSTLGGWTSTTGPASPKTIYINYIAVATGTAARPVTYVIQIVRANKVFCEISNNATENAAIITRGARRC
jgi:prepilin-type N-terminal cleavage/methylation domain-containing protein